MTSAYADPFDQPRKEDAPPAAVTAVESGLRAVLYMRVSSDTPVTTDSVDAQRVACQHLIEQLGLTLVDVYIEPERTATETSA